MQKKDSETRHKEYLNWYAKNREKYLKKLRDKYASDEDFREYNKRKRLSYYKKYKNFIRERNNKWYKENREKVSLYMKKYRKTHKTFRQFKIHLKEIKGRWSWVVTHKTIKSFVLESKKSFTTINAAWNSAKQELR